MPDLVEDLFLPGEGFLLWVLLPRVSRYDIFHLGRLEVQGTIAPMHAELQLCSRTWIEAASRMEGPWRRHENLADGAGLERAARARRERVVYLGLAALLDEIIGFGCGRLSLR